MARKKARIVEAIILGVAFLCVLALALAYAFASKPSAYQVEISLRGQRVGVLSLNQDAVFPVATEHGTVCVTVAGGKVAITSSPCKDQICVRKGFLDKEGEGSVCAPEGVSIYLLGPSAIGEVRL